MYRVLYVDDDPDLRDLAEMSLSADPDIDTLTAADAATALRIVADEAIDLVIADLRMPDMDGRALLRRLRDDAGGAQPVRVLVTTAVGPAADTERMIAEGAIGLLKKPFDPLDLPRIVRHLLAADTAARAETAVLDAAFGLLR